MSVDAIIELVERYVPGVRLAHEAVAGIQTVRTALDALQRVEGKVTTCRDMLIAVKELGIATEDDFTGFDVIRGNLYAAQFGWYTLLKNTFYSALSREAAQRLPAPVMGPGVQRPSRLYRAKAPAFFVSFPAVASNNVAVRPNISGMNVSGMNSGTGLGAVQFAWVAAVIAIIVALALAVVYAYIISSAVEEISRVLIVEKQTEQYQELLRARTEAYQTCLANSNAAFDACVANGGAADVCRETILSQCLDAAGVLIPTPDDAGLRPPESSDPFKWIVVGAGAVIVLIVGTMIYAWKRQHLGHLDGGLAIGSSSTVRRRRRRRRALRGGAERVFDLDGPSKYNLEVE